MWLRLLTFLALLQFGVFKSEPIQFGSKVDYSFRGLSRQQFFQIYQHLVNPKEVRELNMRGNKLDSFLDCSTSLLENLDTLDLSQNELQRFFFVCKEYKLQVLNVSHNNIEYIEDTALNHRLPKLKILDLSNNKLAIVNETMLEHLTMLEYLNLSHNPMGDGIHDNALWNLTALKHLDLRNVSAPFFSDNFFKTLTNLSTLDLAWNPISTIPLLPVQLLELDLSGTQLTNFPNLYLPKLRELRLNYMRNFTSLTLNDLFNLTSLETLSMIGCKQLIEFYFWPEYGAVLPRLQRLFLQEGGLETLNSEFSALVLRTNVELGNNPWRCDCKMEWIVPLNLSDLNRHIRCITPDHLRGRLLTEISIDDLVCESDSSLVLHSILWTCITISIIVSIIAFTFVFKRSNFVFGRWSFRGKNKNSVMYTNVVESNNDLVRILAETQDHE